MDAIIRSKRIIGYITLYMLLTYLLAFVSPSRFEYKYPVILTLLVCCYILAFYLGSYYGINRQSYKNDRIQYVGYSEKGLNICLIVLLVYTIIAMLNNMAATGVSNLESALLKSVSDAQNVYYAKGGLESNIIMNYITILLSPVFVYASLFGLLKIKYLSSPFKTIVILYLFFEVLRWMFIGTNKGIFDIVILLIVSLILFNDSIGKKNRIDPKIVILIIVFGLLAIWVFSLTMQSRLGSRYSQIQGLGKLPTNYHHILFKILPADIVIVIIRFIDYLVQGYYGLSLGLTLKWQPTFFAGSNVFLQRFIQPLSGIDISSNLFQTRIENAYGWGATSNWHTMYLWLANDFSFPGVIVIMGLIGYVFGSSLLDGLKNNNPYGLCLAYLLAKAMFYSSANNQILGTYSIFTVIVFFFLWKKNKLYRFKFGNN